MSLTRKYPQISSQDHSYNHDHHNHKKQIIAITENPKQKKIIEVKRVSKKGIKKHKKPNRMNRRESN